MKGNRLYNWNKSLVYLKTPTKEHTEKVLETENALVSNLFPLFHD